MSDQGTPNNANKAEETPQQTEHLNIKVTDNNNEVFFKIKRTTQLKKLMDAFCERQGKSPQTVRFLFDGERVNATDNPNTVGAISANVCVICDETFFFPPENGSLSTHVSQNLIMFHTKPQITQHKLITLSLARHARWRYS
jgi:hypothetical protein